MDMETDPAPAASEPAVVPRLSVPGDHHIIGPHSALLYYAGDVQPPVPATLSEDFFEPRSSDVESMYRDLQAKRRDLDDAPLLTSKFRNEYREGAILRNLSEHPESIIRIRFPDRHVLQGTFRGIDTVEAIISWVKGFLQDENLNFYLFTSPPRRVLTTGTGRLVELGLVGCSVIYFGTEQNVTSYLKLDLRLSCPQTVFQRVKSGPAQPADPLSLVNDQPSTTPMIPEPQVAGPSSRIPSQNSGKVPKWFKLGK